MENCSSSLHEILRKVIGIIQKVCAAFLIIVGVVLVWFGGFPATIGTLSSPIVTSGFTLFGVGIAIASFVISENNQKELLETLKARK